MIGTVGPGWFGTSNTNLDLNIPINSGSAGARVVEDQLFVTDQNGLTVYDISDPALPVPKGFVAIPQQYYYTEEDVPSNGEIALVGQFGDLTPAIQLNVVDVSLADNPSGQPRVIGTLSGLDEHTFECARDCTYAYGTAGAVIDLTDPTKPKDIGEWDDAVKAQVDPATGANYAFRNSTHDVTEAVPGILLTSSNPMFLLDVRTTPATPVALPPRPPGQRGGPCRRGLGARLGGIRRLRPGGRRDAQVGDGVQQGRWCVHDIGLDDHACGFDRRRHLGHQLRPHDV